MKYKPILFSTPMVQAILEGRKTMTRRVLKGGTPLGNWDETLTHCRYGKPDDILWVRETFIKATSIVAGVTREYAYKADGSSFGDYEIEKWRPSIFMPKDACRLFLKVTDVRVESLHDIRNEDAKREGVRGVEWSEYDSGGMPNYIDPFSKLWRSINGDESWQANPWVWVISFKKIDKPNSF